MAHDFNGRTVLAERDGHDVEPARAIVQMTTPEVIARGLDESAPLRGGDRFGRAPKRRPLSRFDLDEHDGRAISGDDVDFSTRRSVPARENCVPETLQLAYREIFTNFAETYAGAGHAMALSKLGARGCRLRALGFGLPDSSRSRLWALDCTRRHASWTLLLKPKA